MPGTSLLRGITMRWDQNGACIPMKQERLVSSAFRIVIVTISLKQRFLAGEFENKEGIYVNH
jgi:hypothetical protein